MDLVAKGIRRCLRLPQSREPQIIPRETLGRGTQRAPQRPADAALCRDRGAILDVVRFAAATIRIKTLMTDEDDCEFKAELMRLQQEHRDLDAAIAALQSSPAPDVLQLQRLKKRKLQLRDRIAFIEDQITPDIIA